MIILYSLLTVLVLFLGYIYYRYHTYNPENKTIEPEKKNLQYFFEEYNDARKAFLDKAKELGNRFNNIEISSIRIDSRTDPDLFMDICHISPAGNSGRLLVLVSGTHGIEGYAGGAVQQMFMNEMISGELIDETGVLLIHSFNPYGQKYFRKTTEFNVDLNRNCVTDSSHFNKINKGYSKLRRLLSPIKKVNKNNIYHRFFFVVAIWKMLQESFSALRQSALQGQYEFPEGIYYGGKEYSQQTLELKKILTGVFEPYKLIFAIDLHTGYGRWGKLHLFANPEHDPRIRSLTSSLFRGYPIHWGDKEDFYEIDGDLSGLLKAIKPESTTLCMPFEFGTLNSQLIFGSLISIHRMILENQGHFHGYANDISEKKVIREYREMYYPSSERWRSEIIRQSRRMLKVCLARFRKMNID